MRGRPGNPSVSDHLQRLIRDDEQINWHAKPDKQSFYAKHIVGGLVSAVFLGFFFAPFGGMVIGFGALALFGEQGVVWTFGSLAVVALVGVPLLVWATARRQYRFAEFAVTDDRVIHSSGLFGRDASTVSLEDIRDIDVSVGLFDKLFGTGKLKFQTAGGSNSGAKFASVPDPYGALETIEAVRREAEQRARASV